MRYSTFSREAREAMERGMRVFVSLRDETFIGLILRLYLELISYTGRVVCGAVGWGRWELGDTTSTVLIDHREILVLLCA
jgi:hypothetical protein